MAKDRQNQEANIADQADVAGADSFSVLSGYSMKLVLFVPLFRHKIELVLPLFTLLSRG